VTPSIPCKATSAIVLKPNKPEQMLFEHSKDKWCEKLEFNQQPVDFQVRRMTEAC
jgi:hypothetical protein